jgi:hypothetical protein
MRTPVSSAQRRSWFAALVQWVRRSDLRSVPAATSERGSVCDLASISGIPPHFGGSKPQNQLLLSLMRAIGLGQDEISAPATLAELQRNCIGCRNWRRCRRELMVHTAPQNWPDYCRNAPRLRLLLERKLNGPFTAPAGGDPAASS